MPHCVGIFQSSFMFGWYMELRGYVCSLVHHTMSVPMSIIHKNCLLSLSLTKWNIQKAVKENQESKNGQHIIKRALKLWLSLHKFYSKCRASEFLLGCFQFYFEGFVSCPTSLFPTLWNFTCVLSACTCACVILNVGKSLPLPCCSQFNMLWQLSLWFYIPILLSDLMPFDQMCFSVCPKLWVLAEFYLFLVCHRSPCRFLLLVPSCWLPQTASLNSQSTILTDAQPDLQLSGSFSTPEQSLPPEPQPSPDLELQLQLISVLQEWSVSTELQLFPDLFLQHPPLAVSLLVALSPNYNLPGSSSTALLPATIFLSWLLIWSLSCCLTSRGVPPPSPAFDGDRLSSPAFTASPAWCSASGLFTCVIGTKAALKR